jgi:hypothetical protein
LSLGLDLENVFAVICDNLRQYIRKTWCPTPTSRFSQTSLMSISLFYREIIIGHVTRIHFWAHFRHTCVWNLVSCRRCGGAHKSLLRRIRTMNSSVISAGILPPLTKRDLTSLWRFVQFIVANWTIIKVF